MYCSLYASSWVNSELSWFYEKSNTLVINQHDCILSNNDDLASFTFFFNEPSKIIGINQDFIKNSNPGFIKSNRQNKLLIDSVEIWFLASISLSVASHE